MAQARVDSPKARRFFVSCAQIFEAYVSAYVDEIRVRLAENQPQKQVQERLRAYIFTSVCKEQNSSLPAANQN
ncbi:hypothetical protein EUBHAL_02771 [Anaerobutyricum hallii DSM 3353]|uniref:Uncharacterized protein n=1 Tax=Anaerobutyricum hallii DSM 3353 TaxID=411469 RepID=C0EZB2_9FIRM|nr:hypothetical protein EUBHAL_02771 [Anaerobutyricum hallii DSM 3353]